MEPFPINAIAVQWEFRCQGDQVPGEPWVWHCRSPEGTIVAKSNGHFKSLHEAIVDANKHGFRYEFPEAR